MQLTVGKEKWDYCLGVLRERITAGSPSECFLDLGGLRKVRLVVADPVALRLIHRELGWILCDPVDNPDATIYLWKVPDVEAFAESLMGKDEKIAVTDDYILIRASQIVGDSAFVWPSGQISLPSREIHFAYGNTYYYGVEDFTPEKWIASGHVLVQMLFRIMNELPEAKLVHGACVGIGGKGVLMCARGQKGKSTLAVTALLDGFDFVSEDYLLLERKDGHLSASPLYSMMTLSPMMYEKLYDRLGKARFMGVGPFKGKYLFDISGYREQVRWHYPIKACVFPEITPDAVKPRVEPCGPMEKNRAITHMAHSTLFQMWCMGLKQKQKDQDFLISVIKMLNGLDFYKIVLTPDIFANVDCLKSFVSSL